MTKRIIPLIMCGGAGTRLWPASREVRPKQFLPLFGKRSTFQDTVLRVSDAGLFERPVIITNAAYRFMVLEQLAEIGIEADVLLEPIRRNSGPAIAAGAAFGRRATEMRSCSRSPPIMLSVTRLPLSRRAPGSGRSGGSTDRDLWHHA
jgi:mannose-1-phosphate guanylyltransferase / mannose-6-phosphate isomerase